MSYGIKSELVLKTCTGELLFGCCSAPNVYTQFMAAIARRSAFIFHASVHRRFGSLGFSFAADFFIALSNESTSTDTRQVADTARLMGLTGLSIAEVRIMKRGLQASEPL